MNKYEIPLTTTSGKIRIKERQTFGDYGLPIAPKQTIINDKHYIEWQISYDRLFDNSLDDNEDFISYNNKKKKLFELSEIINYFYKKDIIKFEQLEKIKNYIENNTDLIDEKLNITRSCFKNNKLADLNFLESFVSYPLLIYKFDDKNFINEIIIKEKQRAIGIQPMLFFYFPLSILKTTTPILGREVQTKEKAILEINDKNIEIFLEMFKIFGILSKAHKNDILRIIDFIQNEKPNISCLK